jgi:serine/threonine-protein kinase
MQIDQARATLQEKQLNVESSQVPSDKPAGTVVAQQPEAGAKVGESTTVTLSVSNGNATTVVPSVIGQDETTATEMLKAQGLGVTTAGQDVADPSLDGLVVAQDPQAGQQTKLGTTVTISLGRFSGP